MAQPSRTCIGCRQIGLQNELIRFALEYPMISSSSEDRFSDEKSSEHNIPIVVIDERREYPGRGAWLHRQHQCFEKAYKKGAFHRAFRTRVQVKKMEIAC